jgi:hypothetical protein
MAKFVEIPDEDLKQILIDTWTAINVSDCFGGTDVHNLVGARIELEKRGYKIREGIRKVKILESRRG